MKYTHEGGVSLKVTLLERQSPWLLFEVEDSGIGIREVDQEIIFSPFEQIGEPMATQSGTGLGLAICKQFVELMGGNIGVTSELGKGSVFHFEIPAIIAAPSSKPATVPYHERIIGLAEGQQRYRLLIVEDELANRLLLRNLLEPLGFDLREATDGQKALECFEQWHPHLIWMDIRMPVMNGLEVTRRIRKSDSGADTRIVALTAHALEEERVEILRAGCDGFIRKPYRDTEIYDALAEHLGVRFLYAKEKLPAPVSEEIELDEEQLKKIPSNLLHDLLQGAVLLDEAHCFEVIGMISDHDHKIGESLRRSVEALQYKEILTTLEKLTGTDINEQGQ